MDFSSIEKALITKLEEDANSFLLVPRLDGQGGMLSLSMPVAHGPITIPPTKAEGWARWLKAFANFWSDSHSRYSTPELKKLLPEIYKSRDNGLLLGWYPDSKKTTHKSHRNKRADGTFLGTLSLRKCLFFRAVIELYKVGDGIFS